MTLDILYERLEKYRDFEQGTNGEKFLEIVDKIIAIKDPKSLSILFKYFDDNDLSWVLESLKSAIQSPQYLNEEDFMKGVLKNLYILFPKAKEWAEGFLYIILNEPKCLESFYQNIHLADQGRLLKLLNIMYEESKQHRPVIDELKAIILKTCDPSLLNAPDPEYEKWVVEEELKRKEEEVKKRQEEELKKNAPPKGELCVYIGRNYYKALWKDGTYKELEYGGEPAAEQMIAKYKDLIKLNYCPNCGNLKMTPKARQCLKCGQFHDPELV